MSLTQREIDDSLEELNLLLRCKMCITSINCHYDHDDKKIHLCFPEINKHTLDFFGQPIYEVEGKEAIKYLKACLDRDSVREKITSDLNHLVFKFSPKRLNSIIVGLRMLKDPRPQEQQARAVLRIKK